MDGRCSAGYKCREAGMAMLASTASPTFFAAAARPQVRPSGGRRVVCNAMADRQMWLPGSEAPAHLKGTLPGDFGFDPLLGH